MLRVFMICGVAVVLTSGKPCWTQQEQLSNLSSTLDERLGNTYRYIGKIQPRHTRDIVGSNWSIGAETMDRDYTVYANWRQYLGPLGVKKARIQSGWAKTEQQRGVYSWDWIDEIVLGMVDQGVEPWVCLCYGNPIYPGGGGAGLGGGLISSEEALQAWDRYVAAFVDRYAKHIDEWELWNEPRPGRGEGAIQYAKFVIRTAETIRQKQPDAKTTFAAGGAFDIVFAKEVLEYLRDQDKLGVIDEIIYHPYSYNPDGSYAAVARLRKIAKSFAPHIDIRQGENGAPSCRGSFGAIADNDWTEESQAKWALRRLLGDLGRDIPSSYFAICDMKYPDRVNFKGLLSINEDKTVLRKKLAYYAVQHLAAVFDNTVQRAKGSSIRVTGGDKESQFTAFSYRGAKGGTYVTLWRSSDTPGDNPQCEQVNLTIDFAKFEYPVWVDLLTGRVYEMDSSLWNATTQGTTFKGLATYDSVVLIVERKEIETLFASSTNRTSQTKP